MAFLSADGNKTFQTKGTKEKLFLFVAKLNADLL